MPLWHERDISHSSAERIILPDSTILVNYMLRSMTRIIRDLHVYPENMQRNMQQTLGLTFSQQVLLALVEKGLAREVAYDLVQKYAMQAWDKQRSFQELLAGDAVIAQTLSLDELNVCFDSVRQLRRIDEIYRGLGI